MSVSLVNRTPLVLQKSAKRAPSGSGQQSHNTGAAVQTYAHGAKPPGSSGTIDKLA